MKFGVIVFPGANCDRDVAYVLRDLLGQPTKMIWHEDSDLSDIDTVIVPGGFSYGDYLRCGAIAQFSPAMQATAAHAKQGKLVMGICNGFQVLTEMGATAGRASAKQRFAFCVRSPPPNRRANRPALDAKLHPRASYYPADCPRRRLLLRRTRHN